MAKKRRAQGKSIRVRQEQRQNGIFSSPIAMRIAAYICDYLIAGVATIAVTTLPYYYLTGGMTTTNLADYATLGIGTPLVALMVLTSTVLTWCYFALLPATIWNGQTLGKRWANLEVVMLNGDGVGLGRFTLRWAIQLFVEVPSIFVIIDLMQLMDLAGVGGLLLVWQTVGGIAFAVSIALMLGSTHHRSIHDLVLGTWVYNGNQ